jgi:hypothetical protein
MVLFSLWPAGGIGERVALSLQYTSKMYNLMDIKQKDRNIK